MGREGKRGERLYYVHSEDNLYKAIMGPSFLGLGTGREMLKLK